MKEKYKKLILEKIKKSGKTPLTYKKLLKSCHVPDKNFKTFTTTLEEMKKQGKIFEGQKGFVLAKYSDLKKATITRLNKTFGFAKDNKTDEEIFIPGKFLKGAMPGDTVLLKELKARSTSPEAEVVSIIEKGFSRFTGNIEKEFADYCVKPDILSQYLLPIDNLPDFDLKIGDKVLCEISYRGERHSEHCCKVIANFGSSQKASVCALSVLELNNISLTFPDDVIDEAKKVSDYKEIDRELKNRFDLRDEIIFTIDGADTKDIDDAISLSRTDKGYKLGVHIADVSHYVKAKSSLDNEALNRGTSVYYANRVIPMLPKELSNGICSLNPQEDRLAFSALMDIDEDGQLLKYKFVKTVIRSRVKGVYSEINSILDNTNSKEIAEKYSEVIDTIPLMYELAKKLKKNRIDRGAPELETSESKLIISEDDICVDVKPRTRGESEEIIEDFMLMANQAAAKLAKDKELPFVFRIHEDPGLEKIQNSEQTLQLLNISIAEYKTIKPKNLAEIVRDARGTKYEMLINNLVLRSMAKAKYSNEPVGHFGLVLDDYAHFTSPIRRYPDLSIHRIMTDYLSGASSAELMKRYQKFVFQSSQRSSETELRAMKIERDCEDCYKAEFLKAHIGEEFEGVVTSVMEFGFFVELENTCEGLVSINSLDDGEYNYDGKMKLMNSITHKSFSIGDKVMIKVAKCDVSSGKIDFVLV